MPLKNISFVTSKPDVNECPKSTLPEYAFVGRSNVGKSSLINMLANNNKLAKTSSMPGKTRLINYFIVDGTWHLVDLPGYGYAKISKKEREKISKIINRYILNRKQLICLFVLIDIRHEALPNDLEFMKWLGINGVPFVIIFTKSDKLDNRNISQMVENYIVRLKEDWENTPDYIITSSENGRGKEEILSYIMNINATLKS